MSGACRVIRCGSHLTPGACTRAWCHGLMAAIRLGEMWSDRFGPSLLSRGYWLLESRQIYLHFNRLVTVSTGIASPWEREFYYSAGFQGPPHLRSLQRRKVR
jgi:hypothetical protein